ncbi:hypothetical protein DFH28DRAFT_1196714 [Melampsora americana]|nr:hypothetical protein DFH28DRAFT_1196714 [Melampsora americana]
MALRPTLKKQPHHHHSTLMKERDHCENMRESNEHNHSYDKEHDKRMGPAPTPGRTVSYNGAQLRDHDRNEDHNPHDWPALAHEESAIHDVLVSSAPSQGKRVKDGLWDLGEGKWEMSRQTNGGNPSAAGGLGATSETDAIQAWKAEMKAMDAKKKQGAAAAAAANPPQAISDLSPDLKKANESEQHQPSHHFPDALNLKLAEPNHEKNAVAIGDSQTPLIASPAKTPHFASLLQTNANSGPATSASADDDVVSQTRASRFAKFFDKNSTQQRDENEHGFGNPPPSAPSHFDLTLSQHNPLHLQQSDHQATRSSMPNEDQGGFLYRSASADPENMARVLSMLQMSV